MKKLVIRCVIKSEPRADVLPSGQQIRATRDAVTEAYKTPFPLRNAPYCFVKKTEEVLLAAQESGRYDRDAKFLYLVD